MHLLSHLRHSPLDGFLDPYRLPAGWQIMSRQGHLEPPLPAVNSPVMNTRHDQISTITRVEDACQSVLHLGRKSPSFSSAIVLKLPVIPELINMGLM